MVDLWYFAANTKAYVASNMEHNGQLPISIQVNLDMTDSMGPGNLVRHMQNPSS